MNKTELFHLHSLLAAVAGDLADRDELATDDLSTYRAVGVSQYDVRSSREDHEDAVLALSRGVADALDSTTEDRRRALAD